MSETIPLGWAEAIARSPNPFLTAMSRYARAPLAFVREVLHAEPDPWQAEMLRALAHGETRISVRSGHGVGKHLPFSERAPTPDGERRWGDLQPGDRLFGRDGEATHIVARYDQGVVPIYRVTLDDGTALRVGADHLWTVRGRAQRRVDTKGSYRKSQGRAEVISEYAPDFITISTAEIIARGVKRRNGAHLARQWELPPHAAVQYPARDVPLAPYLLGATLADGGLTQKSLRLTGSAEKVAHWQRHCHDAGLAFRVKRSGDDRWDMTMYGQMATLRDLQIAGLTGNARAVPVAYRENTPAVRLAVLQGLMDADGHCDDRGIAVYTSVSPRLAADVAWLVRSLGGKAFLGDAQPSHYRKAGELIRAQDHYDVTVRLPPGLDLFTLPSKARRMRPCQERYLVRWIDSIEPDGEEAAMCVQVDAPDALYHAGDFIVTHNSAGAAWAMTWFANTRAPFKIGVTAPSAPQLFDALWPEMRMWFGRLPDAWRDLWDITSDRITLKAAPDECFITARTARADKPEALQGLHSPNIMLVADEASGIDEAVFEAAGGSMSSPGAITILLGNPTRATGFFWRTHMLERDRWWARRVSSTDSKRVDPKFCAEIAERYGLESNAYRVRVLGEFPLADSDTLIGAALVDEAMKRDVALDLTAPELWGVDVARFGSDSSVLLKRRGFVVPEMPRRWRQIDTMTLAGAIKAEYDLAKASKPPALIVVDVIGIGAGVVDRLGEQSLPVLGVNVAESPSTTARFARLRDELWFRAREWLEARHCRLPYNEQFRDDLCGPRYSFLSDGRMQVESKNAMRSRGLSSPDIADAFCLTFAEHGLAIAGGMTSGLHDNRPLRDAIMGME